MRQTMRRTLAALAFTAAAVAVPMTAVAQVPEERVLRVVPYADLQSVDPIGTTPAIVHLVETPPEKGGTGPLDHVAFKGDDFDGLTDLAEAHGRWRQIDSRMLGSDRLEVYERARG